MHSWSLAFLVGVLCLQNFTYLPSLKWVLGVVIFLLLIYWLGRQRYWTYLRLIFAVGCGFAWCLWYAHALSSWSLPAEEEGKIMAVTGYIASLPSKTPHNMAFLFALDEFNHAPAHGLARLNWQNDKQVLSVGDKWQLFVRLKRIHGTLNPGGFDYEAYAFQTGVRANGYVVKNKGNIQLSSHWYHYCIDRIRQYLANCIEKNLPKSNTSPWITALAIGERNNIEAKNWQILRNTGTNHLMAIAGLHIGCMAGFAHYIVVWVWRRIPFLCLRIPAIHAGAVAALLMALMYSALAGFSIPTQRACIMLTVFLVTVLWCRKIAAWQAWGGALLLVLLLNPLNVLTESFWLSFYSVALIIYGMSGRLAPTALDSNKINIVSSTLVAEGFFKRLTLKGLWWKYGRIQWVIAVGLIPLSIWLFQQCSVVSFVANSIAIPWVACLVVPLTLLGCLLAIFSAPVGGYILLLADKVLSVLWVILAYLSQLSWASWHQVIPVQWILISACVAMVMLLLPAGAPGRWMGIIWLLPLLLYKPAFPKPGEIWLTLLDVGQGLSIVIQTQHHVLVFDAGSKLGESFDMGDSVVVPFLYSIAAKQIDMLVISHGDNDHIGGAHAILSQLATQIVKTSVPDKLATVQATLCQRGEKWNWDNVGFEFLYPPENKLNLINDSSCVLRVSSGGQHILLTGDIEKLAERYLVNENTSDLSATILVAPHHGSKTSAENEFISAVQPRYVLFATGYRNRYHFPHAVVMKKYQELGAILYDTAQVGAIQLRVTANGYISVQQLYRKQHLHYWNFNAAALSRKH